MSFQDCLNVIGDSNHENRSGVNIIIFMDISF